MRLRPLGHLSRSNDSISAEERVGVEPTLDLRPNLISNQAPSATRPSLQDCFALAKADRLSPDAGPVDWFRAGSVDGLRSRSPLELGTVLAQARHALPKSGAGKLRTDRVAP